jgi:hypothetical protein
VRLTEDEVAALERHYVTRKPPYYGTKSGY